MVSLTISDQPSVQKRLMHFLAAFTAPRWAQQSVNEQTPEDYIRCGKILDLVLEILLDANLGLAPDIRRNNHYDAADTTRRLTAPQTGARFEIYVGRNGGYDLRVITEGSIFTGSALNFEALAMALRTFGALDQKPGRNMHKQG